MRSLDCDEAQGFLFSQPVAARDFVKMPTAGEGKRQAYLLPGRPA